MGRSISWETHEKLEKNRRDGRLCAGGRRHCTARATRKVFTDFWATCEDKDAGKTPYRTAADDSGMVMCKRHADQMGTEGGNFVVRRVERY